jgi:hypothetical protein
LFRKKKLGLFGRNVFKPPKLAMISQNDNENGTISAPKIAFPVELLERLIAVESAVMREL